MPRLVGDREPTDTRIALLLHQMLDQRGQAIGEVVHRQGTAVDTPHRIVAPLRKGVPGDVAPHLLEEDVHVPALTPIKDAVEDSHLGIVEVELVSFRLVHPLLDLHAAPIQPEPVGVAIEVLPGGLVFRRRIRTPGAASFRLSRLVGNRLLDRVPGGSHPSSHHILHFRRVNVDGYFSRQAEGRRQAKQDRNRENVSASHDRNAPA